MLARILIITYDPDAFELKKPLTFLGKWCRPYNQRHKWLSVDYNMVCNPLNDGKNKLKSFNYIESFIEEILVEMVTMLNNHHNTSFSLRFWRIVLGPWLIHFANIVYIKWGLIHSAIEQNNISYARIADDKLPSNVPYSFKEFSESMFSEEWNIKLTSIIIKYYTQIKVSTINKKDYKSVRFNKIRGKFINKILRKFSDSLWWLEKKINENEQVFIIASTLGYIQEIFLQIKLRQLPKIWTSQEVEKKHQANHQLRDKLSENRLVGFPGALRSLIWKQIPICYLEGFKSLVAQAQKLNWPEFPKAILSSMAMTMENDIFKTWAGLKTEKGTPLLSIQHGGFYGTALFNPIESHEIKISDYFLSWGWDSANKKVLPSIMHKYAGFNFKKNIIGDDLLLINLAVSQFDYRISSTIMANQFLNYFNEQVQFISALPQEIKKHLKMRFYNNDYGWFQKSRLEGIINDSNISKESYIKSILKARVVVSTYNSTTILETLAFNIPTIAYFNPEYELMNKRATNDFNELKTIGILHVTPLSAANHICHVWDDISTWWESPKVQKVRKEFVSRYARHEKKSLDIFANQVKNICSVI